MSGVRNVTQVTPRVPSQQASAASTAEAPAAGGSSGSSGGARSRPDDFVGRPQGLRPSDPQISVQPSPFSSVRNDLFRARAEGEPVVINKTATPNAAIQDLQTTESKLQIDEDVPVEKLKLDLDIGHTWKGDLKVSLTSPSGKTVVVHDRTGGSTDNVKGSFDLSQAFAGESTKGEWKLTVEDKARQDVGTLNSWSLGIEGKAQKPPEPKPQGDPVVVVLDGGVDYRHTDLDGAMWKNAGEVAGDGIDNDGNGIVDDVHGFNVGRMNGDPAQGSAMDHGTHVAGIIAAEDNGVGNTGFAAGKAKIMSIGGVYDGADLLTNFERSVDYMVMMKKEKGVNIRVVNASFGGPYPNAADQARWNAAVQKLNDADILLAAATDNGNGSNMNNKPDMPANVDLPNVVTVAAMDQRNDKLASFSSHGDKVVELAAVGENVLSTVPGNRHRTMSGTSMATPTVAAAAALAFSINPNLTASQVRDILMQTVDKDSDLTGKVSTGGKLNIAKVIEAAKATLPPAEDWFQTAA
jgi:subtilisin-like proprotein convertase family protein